MEETIIFYEKKRGSKPNRYVNTGYFYDSQHCSDAYLAAELHVNMDNTEGNYYYSTLDDVKLSFPDILVKSLSCSKPVKAGKFYSVK